MSNIGIAHESIARLILKLVEPHVMVVEGINWPASPAYAPLARSRLDWLEGISEACR
jgi:hypothetical protein